MKLPIGDNELRVLTEALDLHPDPLASEIRKRAEDLAEEQNDPKLAKYKKVAIARHHDEGTLEVDAGATVSKGDGSGAYVEAWVWVSDDEIPETTGEGDERRTEQERTGQTPQ